MTACVKSRPSLRSWANSFCTMASAMSMPAVTPAAVTILPSNTYRLLGSGAALK